MNIAIYLINKTYCNIFYKARRIAIYFIMQDAFKYVYDIKNIAICFMKQDILIHFMKLDVLNIFHETRILLYIAWNKMYCNMYVYRMTSMNN